VTPVRSNFFDNYQ